MEKKLHNKERQNRNNMHHNILPEENQVFEGTKDDDFISELPDDILFRIISSLPYETLIETRTLSKRWRELWKRASDFFGTIDGIPIVITSLLDQFYRQTAAHNHREVQLHFDHSGGLLATIEDNGTLHLNFSDGGQKTLEHFNWRLNLNWQFIIPKAFSFGFQSVKALHLTCVNHLTKEKVSFLASYLLLESLHITDCKGLWSLFIHCGSSLKTLKIVNCLELTDVYLFTDKLKNLCFQGNIPWLWLHGMPFLENVMFQSPAYFCHPSLLQSLVRVVNVKMLTVSGWLFTDAIRIRPEFIMKQNILLKNLKELRWIESSMDNLKIDTLILFLSICPSLEKLFINVKMDVTSIDTPDETIATIYRDALTNKVKNTCLNHLRVIKFENFTNERDEFKLAERLRKVVSAGAIFLATPNGE